MRCASHSVARQPERTLRNETTEKIRMLFTLALREYELDHIADVERLCLQILAFDVRHADALYLLGLAGLKTQRYEMAERMIRRAIAANPRQAFYHSNLGNALKAQNKLDEAVSCFDRAIKINPVHEESFYNLGNTLLIQKKLEEAVAAYKRALEINPRFLDALCNLGAAYRQQKKLDEAIDCFERAMIMAPEHADLCCNLGDALHAQGKVDEAIFWYTRTLELDPKHSKACNCLCNGYFDKGDLVQSMAWGERCLALNPHFGDARMNQCLLQLLQGDYVNGWRNYEVRWEVYTPRTFSQPLWLGAPLKGARILLHAEQGLGDSLQFLRYVPLVQAAGGKVMLDLPAKLHRLVNGFPGILALIKTGGPLPYFDCHCPLMSLPLAFGTTLETVPARVPYLSAPPEALQAAATLPLPASGLKVGLAWTGNPDHPKNRFRSVPLEILESLLDLPDVHFYSLQMGPAAADLAARKLPITDLAPFTGDMADTAAQMANLDLIVTIDTSMAHLAGALARPVWVLLGHTPDWRWLMDREDSPWYPTARLFRQRRDGDWRPVIDRVRTALLELIASRKD